MSNVGPCLEYEDFRGGLWLPCCTEPRGPWLSEVRAQEPSRLSAKRLTRRHLCTGPSQGQVIADIGCPQNPARSSPAQPIARADMPRSAGSCRSAHTLGAQCNHSLVRSVTPALAVLAPSRRLVPTRAARLSVLRWVCLVQARCQRPSRPVASAPPDALSAGQDWFFSVTLRV